MKTGLLFAGLCAAKISVEEALAKAQMDEYEEIVTVEPQTEDPGDGLPTISDGRGNLDMLAKPAGQRIFVGIDYCGEVSEEYYPPGQEFLGEGGFNYDFGSLLDATRSQGKMVYDGVHLLAKACGAENLDKFIAGWPYRRNQLMVTLPDEYYDKLSAEAVAMPEKVLVQIDTEPRTGQPENVYWVSPDQRLLTQVSLARPADKYLVQERQRVKGTTFSSECAICQ